ncbi:MAG: DUF1491 family protein [Rhodomicrobium sp.]|nr:DUF1491 family protein [Rhodomicrobium sp.]
MRLKSGIWVSAYIRQLGTIPIPALVVRRGDGDAGAIFIKISTLDGFAQVLRPASAGIERGEGARFWAIALRAGRAEESAADAYLARQADFDSDIWIIEVEDREGRHFLDDCLIAE